MNERERVAFLARRFPAFGSDVRTGIGDDAAVLTGRSAAGEALVWTVDAQVEGTHFRLEWLSWKDVGWRSFMAAASDLAAMGASPHAALSSLVLAGSVDDAAFDQLTEGQALAARAVGAPIVGGNLARGRETSITTTLLGHAAHPVLRSGAAPGHGIFLGGDVGMAGAGLALLSASASSPTRNHDPCMAACIDAWRRPVAKIDLGRLLRTRASAAVDVSDGLARDAGHIAEASAVTLVFDEAALRGTLSPSLRSVAAHLGRDPIEFALGRGEDYALVVTAELEAGAHLPGFVRVGVVEEGPPSILLEGDGRRRPAPTLGFDHFPS